MSAPRQSKSEITLRPFENADFPIVFQWIKNQRSLFCDDGPKTEREFVDHRIERDVRNFGVYRDGELVGLFVCEHISPLVAEAHVFFKRSFWGWENTSVALRLGIDFAFGEGGYSKITSPVFETNRLMIRLLERLGAVQEGFFWHHARQNGLLINVCWFSIFKENYRG